MRNRIFMVCIISVLSATASVYGNSNHKTAPVGYSNVIQDFINSHVNSDYRKLDGILNDEACFKIPRGEKVLVQNKASLIDQMKKDKGTQQNCESKYEVLAKSDAMVIARVDFKYDNCTQHDYVILEKNSDKEWKITQVCKMFEDVKEIDGTGNALVSN